MRRYGFLLLIFVSCQPGDHAKKKLIMISADAEWKIVRSVYPDEPVAPTPWGEYFEKEIATRKSAEKVIFFHGGWGKVAAAGSAQYCIDRWHPEYVINIGTCGGFEDQIRKYDVILVDRTVIYDIGEAMSDSQEAIDSYSTKLDLSWLQGPLPSSVTRTLLVSGDRDLIPAEVPRLASTYKAIAGDWESGAIAYTCARNGQKLLILRGVTDLVNTKHGEAYGNNDVFLQGTDTVMRRLLRELPAWMEKCE